MSKGPRAELERLVQDLDRAHPEWSAREIEAELARIAAVRFGDWRTYTPNPRARLRQIQRWRSGFTTLPRPSSGRPLFHHLWPFGERQRRAFDASFAARMTRLRASHRIFLRNCSEEPLLEVRVTLSGVPIGYEPRLEPGGFFEIDWLKNPAIRNGAMTAPPHEKILHPLSVEFAYSKGTRSGRLAGSATLDSTDGWESFHSADHLEKELF